MMEARDELCGRTVGEFVLRQRIGEGGYGAVYRCEQPLLGREAVVKVLHHRHRASPVIIQRFLREARLASRLDHPYAAHIYAFGVEQEDGLLWIAMEMVHGTPLDRWLRERGPLALAKLVPFFERIAEVVQTGHERGIVHRDLKPSNVMVVERAGRLLPKLLDFGIAKLLVEESAEAPQRAAHPAGNSAPAAPRLARPLPPGTGTLTDTMEAEAPGVPLQAELTATGMVMGSPPYMAPEQWHGDEVGPRADLYALGVLAYEALAGRRPFQATTMVDFAHLHTNQPVPPLDGSHPPALDRFFARALAKSPLERPGSALELAATLRVASGLAEDPAELPRLERGIHDAWIADAPQPLAEAVAALEGARNLYQARDAAHELFRTLVRYLLGLALATRAQVREARIDPGADALLRELGRRTLDDAERVQLMRRLAGAFADQRGAYPIPPLVALLVPAEGENDALEPVLQLNRSTDPRGLGEELLRSQLAQTVPALGRLLRAASFVLDYPLVIVRSGACESWMGHRRVRRRLATISGPTPLERQPVLVGREGRSSLVLWPLAQVSPPTPGVDDELFLFDGPDRRGARMVAAPHGFELHDPGLWDWLGEHALARSDEHAAATAEVRAPFLGLEAFSAADADRFFGREREADALANRLRTASLQIVVGPSGAGKSSFVHAGIVPALPPGSRIVTMRPGHRPVAILAARLGAAGIAAAEAGATLEEAPQSAAARIADAAGDGLIVIVVDQLEELFTLCRDEVARERFCALVDLLTSTVDGRVRVICTMRDDFLMRAAALPVLGPRVAPCIFLLGNPSREDLIRTVVEPARQAGYELSDAELAPEMADAVAGRPGALALLSFTASQLWELRDRRFHQLTRRAYEAMGGVGGALGQHAERTIAALGAEERRLVREAFRHLVTAEGTRAQLSIAELGQVLASPSASAVIDKLVAARLLVIAEHEDGARVEIIHEALLAAWPRVQEWLREDADSSSMRDQVRSAARQWNERGRSRGLLWHDDALAELERWRRRREDPGLTAGERAFADASRNAATRVRRVRRIALVMAFAVLGIALAVMFWLRGEAAHQRSLVQEQLVQSYVDRGQQALLGGNVELALESLEAAFRMGARTPTVRFLLARARESKEAELVTLRGHDGRVESVAFSPDRTRVLTCGQDGTIRIWDPTTGRVLQILRDHAYPAVAAWNPSGQGIVTADTAGTVRLWTDDGRLRATLNSDRGTTTQITFRGDGALFALVRTDGEVVIRDARSGELRGAWMADPKGLFSVAFDLSGTRVVTAGNSGVAVVWSIEGQQQVKLEGHDDAIWSAVFDHGGARVITVSLDATAYVWDAHTGKALHRLQGHDGRVTNVAIDDRDRLIATTGTDETARIWSLDTGKLLATLRGHTAQVNNAIFAPDDQLVTVAADGTARIWDLTLGTQIAMYHHGGFLARGADLDPQARRLATASWSGTAKIWDLRRQSRIRTFSHPIAQITRGFKSPRAELAAGRLARIGPRGVAVWELFTSDFWMRELPEVADGTLTSDGQTVIAADTRGMLHVLDASGQLRHRFHAHAQKISSVAAYPDGRRVATCGVDGTIAVWEFPSGRKLAQRRVGAVNAIRLSPDGSAMFAFEKGRELEGKATGWILAGDLSRVISLDHDAGLFDVAFSPGKAQLATLTQDGIARIWNLDGELEATLHHSGALMSAAWSSDGSWLATGTASGVLTIWDQSSWQARKKIEAHSNFISALAFDENGTLLASAGGDGLAKIWDTEQFFQVGEVPTDGLVQHLVFTRGQLLVSGMRATQSWRCDHYQGQTRNGPGG